MENQHRNIYILEQFNFTQKEDIQEAQTKSLTLLENVLPKLIIPKLTHNTNKMIAHNYPNLTILAADIVGNVLHVFIVSNFGKTLHPSHQPYLLYN